MKEKLKQIIISMLTWEARAVLKRHKPKVIAITGSLGKTGTKDAVAAALGAQYSVRKSPKSFNSEFGVPLTILGLPNAWNNPVRWLLSIVKGFFIALFTREYEEVLVLEVGADKPGDIASLAKWLTADVVIITAVPSVPVHVEFYPTVEDILREKASLVGALKNGGLLITGADEFVSTLENLDGETLRIQQDAVSEVMYEDGLPVGMKLTIGDATLVLNGVLGEHQGLAPAFALAVANKLGVGSQQAVEALEGMIRTPGRMRLLSGKKGNMIIDDSYNSSPLALKSALETLGSLDISGRKIAIIGDMRELGEHTAREHRRAGAQVAHVVDELYTVGEYVPGLVEAAKADGLGELHIHEYGVHEAQQAGQDVLSVLQKGDVVLVKGSQGQLRLEKAVKVLMLEEDKAAALLVRQDLEWLKR